MRTKGSWLGQKCFFSYRPKHSIWQIPGSEFAVNFTLSCSKQFGVFIRFIAEQCDHTFSVELVAMRPQNQDKA